MRDYDGGVMASESFETGSNEHDALLIRNLESLWYRKTGENAGLASTCRFGSFPSTRR